MSEGKVVLLIGGATGLGRAPSLVFARQRAHIAAVNPVEKYGLFIFSTANAASQLPVR